MIALTNHAQLVVVLAFLAGFVLGGIMVAIYYDSKVKNLKPKEDPEVHSPLVSRAKTIMKNGIFLRNDTSGGYLVFMYPAGLHTAFFVEIRKAKAAGFEVESIGGKNNLALLHYI